MAHPAPAGVLARPVRVLSLVVLVAAALVPGAAALAQGAGGWALMGVVPLLIALVVLARDHDARARDAARRIVTLERDRHRLGRDRDRLAASVRQVGRAFGSLDLGALAAKLAETAADALDADRSLVLVAGKAAASGAEDAGLDTLLHGAAARAVRRRMPVILPGAGGAVAIAHPVGDAGDVLAVARASGSFTGEEESLLAWLAGQAVTSVATVAVHERLRQQAHVDELTGLGNKRAFHETLARELALTRRTGVPVGLIVIDLDDFKAVNDTHGHPVGDQVLVEVAVSLRDAVRSTDTVVRWGGEEFAVVLPHTDLRGAAVVAETVRAAVGGTRVPLRDGGELRVTASVGVAAAPDCAGDPDGLYAIADQALYVAKQRGKDRSCVAGLDVPR
ncbi:hypothetical protein DSM112329_00285 [Paraconexibacter sp. AEG42_29]|uniref:GGDEF domain-containing protein n=1 Tax=Paraconexibacter sp. AEG42_29 TaxID=2997339 RepID=A0AAU7APE6_9ACTN